LFTHAVTSKLTIFYRTSVIAKAGTPFALQTLKLQWCAAETDMKIYLLIMLIGSLLAAIHFTSAPKQQSETLPQ
jgi:hypothetical protein